MRQLPTSRRWTRRSTGLACGLPSRKDVVSTDFSTNVPTEETSLPFSSGDFPLAPPDGSTAEQIFLDFKQTFEAFKQWHCRQRRKLLQLKYDQSCHRFFHELRPPKRDQLDLLWHNKDYTILVVDQATHQIHVDQPVNDLTGCVRFVSNMQVEVETADGDVLGLHALCHHVEPGDLLQCHHYFSEVTQVHQALIDLWKPRWQKASMVGTEHCNRIMGFIHAYMPRLQFPELDFFTSEMEDSIESFSSQACQRC